MQDAIILYENGKAIGGEGHPTNASDITFDNAGTDLVSENVEDAIVEVNAKTSGLTRMTKLWENPSPTASFAAQTITLSSDDYDFLMIAYAYYAEPLSSMRQYSLWVPKGYSTNLTSNDTSNSGAAALSRAMTRNSDTSFSVGICYQAIGTSAQATRADAIIPITIYGIKII